MNYHESTDIPEVIPADQALHELVSDPDIYLFGHGTASAANAAEINQHGLRMNQPYLWSTVVGLETTAENPDAFDADKAMIEDWPHNGTNYVAVLGVQRLHDEVPHRKYLQSIVQPRENVDQVNEDFGQAYEVNPRFVAGYFDAEQGTFTRNAAFDPTYDAALLNTTADKDIVLEKTPLPPAELFGHVAVSEVYEPPTAPDDETPDVWD